jgi:hypothetical protein
MKRKFRKGSLSDLSLGVVIALVSLFIGLYMITKVADVTAINNSSDFYSVYTNLTANTGTIFDVMILVIIVVSLGVAIAVLRGFGAGGGGISAI